MGKGLRFFFALILVMGIISQANAGVYFSQLKQSYNLGDILDLSLTVDPVGEGPLKIQLICNNKIKDIFNGPAITNLKVPLNYYWIEDLSGECFFSADYSSETKKSGNFRISRALDVFLDIDSFFAKPGETITVSGNVKKGSGGESDGEVEISIPFSVQVKSVSNDSNQTSLENKQFFYSKISGGIFSASFAIPENIAAGDYKIIVNAYEKSFSGEKTNEGSANANLKISQILKSVDFAINNQNFDPGSSLSFKPVLLDQTGSPIKEQVVVIITDEKMNRVFERVIQSDETVEYKIPTNQKAGYYSIRISSEGLNLSKNIYINEKAIASFELRNATLVIKNIGNIPYKKEIQIELNGKPFVKKVELEIGKSREFRLTGTEGNYDLKVSDGESEFRQGGVFLTGKAVGVSDNKEGAIIEKVNPFVWFFLIIILLGGISFFFFGVYKKRSIARPTDLDSKKVLKLNGVVQTEKQRIENEKSSAEEKKSIIKKSIMIPKRIASITEAAPGMVLRGEKSPSAVLAIKIKNKIPHSSKIELENALNPIYGKKGCIYEHGEFIIAIFSSLITRSLRNEIEASKVAEKIASSLNEHNRKFNDKIEFGIGINSGEIINEVRDGKLLFTSSGTLVITSKKLAELSNAEILITKEAYERGISEIKAERKKVGNMDVYEVKRVIDYDKNKKFIDDFVKRNEKTSQKNFNRLVSKNQNFIQDNSVNKNNNQIAAPFKSLTEGSNSG